MPPGGLFPGCSHRPEIPLRLGTWAWDHQLCIALPGTSWERKMLREAGQGRKCGVVFTRLGSSPSLGVGSQGPYLHLTIFVLTKTPFPFRGLSLPISTMGLQSLSQVCSLRKPFRVCFGKNPETALRKSPGGLNSLLRHSHLAPSFLVPPTSPQSPGLPSGSPHPQVDDDCGFCFSH